MIYIKNKASFLYERVPTNWCAWVARVFNCLTTDFSTAHDLSVVGSSPLAGSTLSGESA